MCPFSQPQQRQQESKKAPRRQRCKEHEVCHHRPEREEYQVVRKEVERQPGHQDRRSQSQDVKSLLRRPNFTNPEAVHAQQQVYEVDEYESHVEKRPQVLRVHAPGCLLVMMKRAPTRDRDLLPSMGEDCGKLIEAPSEGVYGKGRLQDGETVLTPGEHDPDIQGKQDGELDRLENAARAGYD